MFALWNRIPLWQKVLAGFALGVLAGVVLGEKADHLKPLGDAFIRLIKMLVVPLVLFAIISSVTAMGGGDNLKRLGLKTIGLFLLTALIASLLGMAIGSLFNWDFGKQLLPGNFTPKHIPSVSQVFLDFLPANPIKAMTDGNILQLIVFAALVGIAINVVGEKAEPVRKFAVAGSEVMFQITRFVIQLTPIGVFGLMAWVVGAYGLAALLPLAKFVAAIYIACLIHIFVVYGGLVKLAGFSPLRFFKAVFPAQMVAFTTSSSYGTLPMSTKVVTENLHVSPKYSSFVLPLGATINMDGCGGIYPAISAIFIAHIYGIPLDWTQYVMIALTATLASVGTAGVPGTAMVMLTVTLNAVGLPLEGIAFIAAIDRVLDMMRTATNVTGDMMVALVVGKSEQQVDMSRTQALPQNAQSA
ncbi:MAG: dicarboxylate/amino acid:cation symporter [Pseudomonadota bacterium]|uniref:dicarboxylate/amino acid:cation symporter n=1 Tax=Gallaecimonas pentaromativorans TaxID=584787 RepID=UPI00067EB117|nr:dicarboxylate/amino acid:cation symporter [Gallaecimonas pentaromativorans]MED5526392.1 dicarboxylate/amino acid:cation symporter [Pseudomonadota bacterium]